MSDLLGITVESGDACEPSLPGSNHAPDDAALAELLRGVKTVAVVGVSPKTDRVSHNVAAWLDAHTPYDLYWVNPTAVGQTILGRPVYGSLADLPLVPDMVDVFRRAESVPPVVDAAIAVGARIVWMQLGIVNEASAAAARAAGLDVIQNRCIKIEYARLINAGAPHR